MSSIHPIATTAHLRATYTRYLKTIYPFQDQALREALWQALEQPDKLVKGPLLESAPPFSHGRSIRDLVQQGVLQPAFAALCSPALPWERALYRHQDQAVTHLVEHQRNLVLATGTGSGKTEAFLIPILNHLLAESAAGRLGPGVRALLLYPTNALANDQLKRLRRVLGHHPAITFGRYTGETEESDEKARSRFYSQFPSEVAPDNEHLSRSRMRSSPPHILLTNYAMLEYLLLRPEDCVLFDGPAGQHWRFLLLDEAHVYDGASGIELAMLLRRLKDRVVGGVAGRLRCIATSATLGGGAADFPQAAEFAASLFGEPFAYHPSDPVQQDVIEATRVPTAKLGATGAELPPELYATLGDCLKRLPPEALPLAELDACLPDAISPPIRQAAQRAAHEQWVHATGTTNRQEQAVDAFLYVLLSGDGRLQRLHAQLAQKAQFLPQLAEQAFPDDPQASDRLIQLVALAVRARPDRDTLPLLPARYHVFARALEGAFVCLDLKAHADKKPCLRLSRHEQCPQCLGAMFELASCARCGAAYIAARAVAVDEEDARRHSLRHLSGDTDDESGRRVYFLLGDSVARTDEDEAVVAGEDLKDEPETTEPWSVCLRCGTAAVGAAVGCACGSAAVIRRLRRVELNGASEPRRCLHCGSRRALGVVYRFLTGQDAPVSVLATALYQQLPPSQERDAASYPGGGRKLLVFSDSRQDAAFFAPYLERTYSHVLRRRLILQALLNSADGRAGILRIEDAVTPLLREATAAGLFRQRQGLAERKKLVTGFLMQEFVALDRRLNLEGIGLLQVRLVRPERWRAPAALLAAPWLLSEEQSWHLIALLLDSLRQQGAVTFPENLDPTDELFEPRNKELFVRGEQADGKAGVLSFLPTRGSNRRVDLLERILLSREPAAPALVREQALTALRGLWRELSDPRGPFREHLQTVSRHKVGIVYRLSHHFWELVPAATGAGFRCGRCRAVSMLNLLGVCPTMGCVGTLEPLPAAVGSADENHYRALYLGMRPVPMSAEEHTAQWTSDEAGRVQEQFINGEINVLSCSTTFEMGVDVGELQAVLMRNVPPTTANYLQRAGRAGRRTDAAAFALTFAQRRSHDLTHYNQPERLVTGRIQPPRIRLANEKIVRRHMQALLLAAFFREARQRHGRIFNSVGDFFAPESAQPAGPALLQQFAEERFAHIRDALLRVVPAELQDEVGTTSWGWLRTAAGDGLLDLLERVDAEVTDDLSTYQRLEREAAEDRNYPLGQHFQHVLRTIRSRQLLGFLASRNLLPKYGFPTDVVALKTEHLHVAEAARIQLERDLRIALSEYAPGAEVVAAKLVWRSGGLYKQPRRDWPEYHYAVCASCRRFHQQKEEFPGDACPSCGSALNQRRTMRGVFIKPEFGFVAARDQVRPAGDARPQRMFTSRVYFAEYAPPVTAASPASAPEFVTVPELSGSGVQVQVYYSRFGKLALVNTGEFQRGFQVCQLCGFAEKSPLPKPRARRGTVERQAHTQPRTGRSCQGYTKTYHLGHDFLTDVVELRLSGSAIDSRNEKLWRTLVYALLEGASQQLGIRREDLDGTLYQCAGIPAIILFDNVPGGAGHVRRIAELARPVFAAAFQRVNSECCGPETSCYECLRSYRNQPYHDSLQRGLVRDFLARVLAQAPVDAAAG